MLPNQTACNDPIELLKSPRLGILLERVKKYDLVILDSPAMLAAPDAYNLAKVVDGVILIAQWGCTNTGDLQSICEYLEGIESKLLGIVLSQTPNKKVQNYYHPQRTKRWFGFTTGINKLITIPLFNTNPLQNIKKITKDDQ